jgi:adenine-specific DNA-methyltransferase
LPWLPKGVRPEAGRSDYSTVSRPFDPPETGKIAVKVINHYGDEVLKVSGAGTSASAARTNV